MRWFVSDTHFGHANIIKYCERPFESVAEMNEAMIEKWNAVVRPEDEVWHLGDVALGKINESLPLVARLNGRKNLVPGNHDRCFSKEKRQRFDLYTEVGFTVWPEVVPSRIGTRHVVLSHFPYAGDSHDEDRFEDLRPNDRGQWLIHGHVHDKWKVNGRQINVGIDAGWGFRPVSEDEIAEVIAAA